MVRWPQKKGFLNQLFEMIMAFTSQNKQTQWTNVPFPEMKHKSATSKSLKNLLGQFDLHFDVCRGGRGRDFKGANAFRKVELSCDQRG